MYSLVGMSAQHDILAGTLKEVQVRIQHRGPFIRFMLHNIIVCTCDASTLFVLPVHRQDSRFDLVMLILRFFKCGQMQVL